MPIILITGSEGNIGTYLVKRLKETKPNFEIIRVGHKKIDDNPGEKEKIYIGDLTDEFFVKKIFSENKIDYVVHAAARSYGSAGFKEEAFTLFKNDAQSLLNVLNQSWQVKKFVYLSSVLVYDSADKTPFT